jgi:hypothetical protein
MFPELTGQQVENVAGAAKRQAAPKGWRFAARIAAK